MRRSYETLAREADVVVIEGAGSPAEPNLMRRDLANMRVARLARAPVLLVGDIDRGGVFASLLGTMVLLPRADRRRVRGFLINKFRGDASLLRPALRDLVRRTRVPVVGVMPLPPAPRPARGGLGRARRRPAGRARRAAGRGAAPASPRQLHRLHSARGRAGRASLVYAEEPAALAGAALLVLPGSKDTIADLRALKARGLAAAVLDHRARGGLVLGICGGYQMLGRAVADPHGVESGGEEPGLGLLPVRTVLGRDKVTRRVRARWRPDGPGFEAYEIHVGETVAEGRDRPLLDVDGRPEGCASDDGRVWGTHLHGLFESGPARRHVLDWAQRAPAPASGPAPADHRVWREAAYDRLADALARRARSTRAERPRRLVSARIFFARPKAGGYHSLSPP